MNWRSLIRLPARDEPTEPEPYDRDDHHGLARYIGDETAHRHACLGCQALDNLRAVSGSDGDRACYEFRDDWLNATYSLSKLLTTAELIAIAPLHLTGLVEAVKAKYGTEDA